MKKGAKGVKKNPTPCGAGFFVCLGYFFVR